ncbi:MAG: hypothetical protein IJ711_10655, partial [Lachnospiraceae bacterium]|nr:hypothetical protein [Lachnospiraceae bacterium]
MKNGNGSLIGKKQSRRRIMPGLRLLAMAGLCLGTALLHPMQAEAARTGGTGGSGIYGGNWEEAKKREKELEEAKKRLEEEARKKAEEEAKKKAEEEARKKAEEAAYNKQHGLKAEDNTYILDLTTGTKAGDNISFFIISYKSGGEDRSIYVFPKAGDFAEGMEELNEYSRKYGVDAQAVNKEYMSYTDVENAAPVGSTATAPMQSGTNNQVVFHTKEKIDQITNVEFFTRYNAAAKTSNEWTCQGLRIYEVDRVRGINMVGGFSKDYFANFTGTLLADVKFQNASQDGGFYTFSWALDVIENFGGITVKDAKGKETYKPNPYLTLKTTDFGEAAKYDPQTNDCYGFRIDIADQPQAGLECLTYRNKASLRGAEYIEDLALKLVYTDVNEKPHIIYLPVVTNALKWAADNGINTTDIAGVAQNGQSLFFAGNIPGLATVQSASVIVGNAMSINACGMKKSSASSRIRQARTTASEQDSLTIRCFAIYHMSDDVNVSVKADGAFLSYSYSGVPVYYQRAETEYGIELKAGEETVLQLSKPEEESDLAPAGWKTKKYLVGVTTDSTVRAGTVADVQMQLTYTNMAGMTANTAWVSLKDKAMDYYGFWYSSDAPTGNFGYLAGMCPGNTLYYVVEAADVDQFTNAQYRLESGTDEWQTNGLQIWVLDTLTAPKAEWTSVSAKNGDTTLTSEVRFYREYTGINILNIQGRTIDGTNDGGDDGDGSTGTYLPDSLLVAGSDTVSWKFKTKGAQEVEEEQYADLTYSMTYEECLQDFGFDKRRETYTVKVQVSDQAVDLSGNGDCGSENNFYFQLLFENGASSVVLANTQLEGDRFRTGNVETFTIGTNKDYGAVTAVRIIPEQVQEDSVIDDKLKIDEISVVRQSGSSFNETYVVEHSALPNDGWIGTQSYLDDAQKKETSSDKIGRMVDEIAVDVPVTAKTNELNILCCLSIEEYAKDTSQFYGEMKMTVEYIKLDGTPAKETFDIVDAMYNYYGKAVQHDTDTDTNGRTTSRQPAVSQTAYMFRGGHTDRFYITLRDVKSLYMVTLTGQSRGDTSQMNISAISFNTVDEEGSLQLSGNDEYVRTGATTYVTSNSVETSETSKLGNTFGKGQDQKIKIGLLTNEIEIKEQGSQWLAVFSREPVSQNDTLNVYIYPTSNSIPIANWDLYTRAFYTNVSGLQLTSALTLMNKHTATDKNDKSYFYLNGLSAKQLASLDHIYAISGNQGNNLNAYIDYAIIQQVRSGTVINTWQRAGNNAMASLGVDMGTQSYVSQGQYDMQKVFLQLSASGTEEAKLTAEKNDIALSLKYTSTIDP